MSLADPGFEVGGVTWDPLESKGVCVCGGGELSDKPKRSRLASSLAEGRRILGGRTPPPGSATDCNS